MNFQVTQWNETLQAQQSLQTAHFKNAEADLGAA